jgi:hypothetical protein
LALGYFGLGISAHLLGARNRMSTILDIENSRESNLADYAWLSGILISVVLFCFVIILLANEAKRSATILAPTALSEGSAAKSSWAAQPEALRAAEAAPSSSPTFEAERKKIALPDVEGNRAIRENHGQFVSLREVKLRKSRAKLYRRSSSIQVGASGRLKTALIALWHHAESRDARFQP